MSPIACTHLSNRYSRHVRLVACPFAAVGCLWLYDWAMYILQKSCKLWQFDKVVAPKTQQKRLFQSSPSTPKCLTFILRVWLCPFWLYRAVPANDSVILIVARCFGHRRWVIVVGTESTPTKLLQGCLSVALLFLSSSSFFCCLNVFIKNRIKWGRTKALNNTKLKYAGQLGCSTRVHLIYSKLCYLPWRQWGGAFFVCP